MLYYLPMTDIRRTLLLDWIEIDSTFSRNKQEIFDLIDWKKVDELKKNLSFRNRTFDDFIRRFSCTDCVIDKKTIFTSPSYENEIKALSDRQVAISTLPRSGSHMISDWVASQLLGKVRHASAMDTGPQRINEPRCFSKPGGPCSLPTGTAGDGPMTTWLYTYERSLPSRTFLPWLDSAKSDKILLLRSCANWLSSFVSRFQARKYSEVFKHVVRIRNGMAGPKS